MEVKKTKRYPNLKMKDGNMYDTTIAIELRESSNDRLVLSIMGYNRYDSGQILDAIDYYEAPTELQKIINIWKKWHLNDMHAGCEHQEELWKDILDEEVWVVPFFLENEFKAKQRVIKEEKINAMLKGESVGLTDEEIGLMMLPEKVTKVFRRTKETDSGIYEYPKEVKKYYYHFKVKSPQQPSSCIEPSIYKRRNCNYELSKEYGLLCKPCPVCGYKYGTSWTYRELPQDVIDFIKSLQEGWYED